MERFRLPSGESSKRRASKYPPAEPGLQFVSRSKRLDGVANAAPHLFGHLNGGHSLPKFYLLQLLVRLLLGADVFANHRLIPTHRRNKISSGPEMLTDEDVYAPTLSARSRLNFYT
jgi:hypothetical protein